MAAESKSQHVSIKPGESRQVFSEQTLRSARKYLMIIQFYFEKWRSKSLIMNLYFQV